MRKVKIYVKQHTIWLFKQKPYKDVASPIATPRIFMKGPNPPLLSSFPAMLNFAFFFAMCKHCLQGCAVSHRPLQICVYCVHSFLSQLVYHCVSLPWVLLCCALYLYMLSLKCRLVNISFGEINQPVRCCSLQRFQSVSAAASNSTYQYVLPR